MRLLAVGTVVTVSPRQIKWLDGTVSEPKPPFKAKVAGYDMGRTKYEVVREIWPGHFSSVVEWVFLGQVEEVTE
jgi:hypothetical protein